MNDEIGPVLREIADLLGQRVQHSQRALELQEESRREQQERAAKMMSQLAEAMPKFELPCCLEFDERGHERRMREIDVRMNQSFEEQQEFHDRLPTALERQNALLEQIVARFGGCRLLRWHSAELVPNSPRPNGNRPR